MAGRRKLKEPIAITGTGKNIETAVVQKSTPLMSLWKSELTLSEFKVLDVYLSRINSHEPEKRRVEITKKEFEKVFGISKFNLAILKLRLEHLMGRVIEITDRDFKKGFHLVSLFEEAIVETNDDEVQTVYLQCTQSAMKYFFNIENLHYFRYTLRSVINMTSRYTYVLFQYLENRRKLGLQWTEKIDKLKAILSCDKEPTYQEYKRFNDMILKKCHRELNEKTECKFDYEPVRTGRKVTAISFTLKSMKISEPLPAEPEEDEDEEFEQLTVEEMPEVAEPKEELKQSPVAEMPEDIEPEEDEEEKENRNKICLGFDDDVFKDFSKEQLIALKNLAWNAKAQSDVERHKRNGFDIFEACQQATADFIKRAIDKAKAYKAYDVYGYVSKIIENEFSNSENK